MATVILFGTRMGLPHCPEFFAAPVSKPFLRQVDLGRAMCYKSCSLFRIRLATVLHARKLTLHFAPLIARQIGKTAADAIVISAIAILSSVAV